MWIVILNFSIFVLLIGFMFYGLMQWSHLIADPEEDDDENVVTDGFYHRIPIWVLVVGMGMYSLAADFIEFFGWKI